MGDNGAMAAPKKVASKKEALPKKVASKKEASPKKDAGEEVFAGFPKETFRFLAGIEKNNKKEWLDERREEYEAYYVAPARAFVAAIGPKLQQISAGIQFEPKVNGSLFRIQRDTRFSKDKTPY